MASLLVLVLALLSTGCSAPGAESGGQIDQRVLDGVAPVSGGSLESLRWVQEQMFRLKLPAVAKCLHRKDRDDLLQDVEADFETSQNARMFQFPEPARLLKEGFIPPSTSPFDKSGAEGDLAVAESCARDDRASDEGAASIQKLHQSLFEDWLMILVNDVLTSNGELAAQERFGKCVERGGVPPEFTSAAGQGGTAESVFLGWVTQRVQTGQVSPNGVEDAPLYVECGQPLWDTRERLLRERRETYVESHRDQLSELSELLYDAGG